MSDDDQRRPALDLPAEHADAGAAAHALAAHLQDALDRHDADAYDASFADDVLWGSPRGLTLRGFAELNGIHHQLMDRGTAPPSRFEVDQITAPAPDVAVAHIRRQALDADGFSEMALYVLVRRDGRWWLAAAQNTPIDSAPRPPTPSR